MDSSAGIAEENSTAIDIIIGPIRCYGLPQLGKSVASNFFLSCHESDSFAILGQKQQGRSRKGEKKKFFKDVNFLCHDFEVLAILK